jgi:hypothetical protein
MVENSELITTHKKVPDKAPKKPVCEYLRPHDD